MESLQNKDRSYELLKEAVALVQAGNVPTGEQIDELKACMLGDMVISAEEAEMLFYMKDQIVKKDQIEGLSDVPGFEELFVDAVTANLLFTGRTPGELDDIEFIWLRDHLEQDYNYDHFEKALLMNIAEKAETLPVNFHNLAKNFADNLEENKGGFSAPELENHMSFLDKLKSLLPHEK